MTSSDRSDVDARRASARRALSVYRWAKAMQSMPLVRYESIEALMAAAKGQQEDRVIYYREEIPDLTQ